MPPINVMMTQSHILNELLGAKNPAAILQRIKSLDYQEASKHLLEATEHPFIKVLLQNGGASLPKTISNMRDGMWMADCGNVEGEFAWIIQSIRPYIREINHFLKLQDDFQNAILLDDTVNSFKILDKIDSEIGYSFWAMENRFSLYEKWYGTEKNWDYLKLVSGETSSPYTKLFANVLSKKSENDTTSLQYKRDLDNLINNLGKREADYFLFKLGYFYPNEYTAFSAMINAESLSPVIDRYTFVIDLLIELFGNKNFIELATLVVKDLRNFGIKDYRLKRILEFNTKSKLVLQDFNFHILKLFDLYSEGKYKEYIDRTPDFLRKQPDSIEVLEVYVKSLIEIDSDFQATGVSESLDEILKCLYNLYKKNDDYFQSKDILIKFSINFSKLPFSKQLLSLCSMLTSSNYNIALNHHYFNNSRFQNPQVILFNNLGNKISFPKNLLKSYLAIKINYSIAKEKIEILNGCNLPDVKFKLYNARIAFLHPNKSDEILYRELINDPRLKIYTKEEAILYLFRYYMVNNSWDKIESLIVDAYFQNKYLIERFDVSTVVNHIIESNYSLSSSKIDLPILFYIHNVDTYFQYAALEQYMDTVKVMKPSELEVPYNNHKTVFLLDKVCSIPVLNNFYLVYESDDEVIEERIKILRKLTEADKENNKHYLEEIASLSQKQKIHETIRTVNDGKISLNFSRIRADKDHNLQSTFNRYKKLKQFSDRDELNLNEITELLKNITETTVTQKLQDAGFLAFKSLFFEIVEHFLFSKEHGLDGDLSTRIRHGVLENQLRSVFSNNSLIATKGVDGNYIDIAHWKTKCEENYVEEKVHNEIQNALKVFSTDIDTYISIIIKDLIQIQSNRHKTKPSALFNYNYSEEYLMILYQGFDNVKNYEEFLNESFSYLTTHTNFLLKLISERFKEQINNSFQAKLDELQDQLKKILLKGEVWKALNNRIHHAKAQIEHELYEVSKWFKISNYSKYGELDIETIVQTAIESINITNSFKIKPNFTSDISSLFARGFYYIDIFKILIENCIQHSQIDIDKLNVDIAVHNNVDEDLNGNLLSTASVIISNNISEKINVEQLNEKLSNVVKNWNSDLSLVNNEKGSGFHKIKRLLKYDIEVNSSDITYNIENYVLSITITFINPVYIDEKDTIY